MRLSTDTSQESLLGLVDELNADAEVHGILVQLPLPEQIDAARVVRAVDPAKDVDGFHPINVGRVALGELDEGFVPATPAGVVAPPRRTSIELAGAEAVVVSRSAIVGKPTALLLLQRHATVTICHSGTRTSPPTRAARTCSWRRSESPVS